MDAFVTNGEDRDQDDVVDKESDDLKIRMAHFSLHFVVGWQNSS